jgi:hypothetical protein
VTCYTQPGKPFMVVHIMHYLPRGDESSPRGRWCICAPALPEVLTLVHDCILLLAKGRRIHYLKPRKAAPNSSISGQGRNLLAKKIHSAKHITTLSPPTSGWGHLDHRQPEEWSQRVGTIPQCHQQCHMTDQSISPTRRRCTQGHRKPRNTTVPHIIN